jgi:hypothetical protein
MNARVSWRLFGLAWSSQHYSTDSLGQAAESRTNGRECYIYPPNRQLRWIPVRRDARDSKERTMTDTPTPTSGAWVLYDFDRDGLDIFDSDRFDYYFLVFKSGSLDDGTVMRALDAGPRGLASDQPDPHDASHYLDPRSVAAYVATPRPEVTDELVAAIATAPRRIFLWHGGAVAGTITGRRLRDSLAGLYGRGLRFVDGQITTVDLDLEDTADDVYRLGDTVLVTPVRMDVLLSTMAELLKERSEGRSEVRAASEARAAKKADQRARREREGRLDALGIVFDDTDALGALAPHREAFAQYGLLDEYAEYVDRIKRAHFSVFVTTTSQHIDDVREACNLAQAHFTERCQYKIQNLLAELPRLEQREKVRAEFEARHGLEMLYTSEVTRALNGQRHYAREARENARSFLTPFGNQKLYVKEDIDRFIASRDSRSSYR